MKTLFLVLAVFAVLITAIVLLVMVNKRSEIKEIKNPIVQKEVPQKLSRFIGFLPYWNLPSKAYSENFPQIMYFGLTVDEKGNLVRSGSEWNAFLSLMSKNNDNVSLVVKQHDGDTVSSFISDSNAPTLLVEDLSGLISKYDLVGINFDFEFDGSTQSLDKDKLSEFVRIVSFDLKKQYPGLLLSFDFSGQVIEKEKSYDIKKIGEVMDFVILMGYDYKTPSSDFAGPVAPLLGEANDHTISEAIFFLGKNIPISKIVLGIPLYGYEWETEDATYKSSAIGKGSLATFSRVSKILGEDKKIKVQWDERAGSPWFAYRENGTLRQIYFENEKSLKEKVNFAKENGLAGVAFWALGYEGDNEKLWDSLQNY